MVPTLDTLIFCFQCQEDPEPAVQNVLPEETVVLWCMQDCMQLPVQQIVFSIIARVLPIS